MGLAEADSPLAAARHNVVVRDMRGYNTSGKPEGVPAYHLDTLAADVAILGIAYGRSNSTLSGMIAAP